MRLAASLLTRSQRALVRFDVVNVWPCLSNLCGMHVKLSKESVAYLNM
jgi:hypothetical protein